MKTALRAPPGDLGVGKDDFRQGLAQGLGITERVTSPTYTLFPCPRPRRTLIHLDAYRLTQGTQLDAPHARGFSDATLLTRHRVAGKCCPTGCRPTPSPSIYRSKRKPTSDCAARTGKNLNDHQADFTRRPRSQPRRSPDHRSATHYLNDRSFCTGNSRGSASPTLSLSKGSA